MPAHDHWCYMVTNKLRTTLYIGVTNDLVRRAAEHRAGALKGFTTRDALKHLVWCEHFREVNDAIACEKRLKGWRRERKDASIAERNPRWLDLAATWQEQEPRADDLVRWAEEMRGEGRDSSAYFVMMRHEGSPMVSARGGRRFQK